MLFLTVRDALSAMIEDIAKREKTKTKVALEKCESFMSTLSEQYYSGTAPALAYEDPFCRWAYVFSHVAANADLLVHALKNFAAKDSNFKAALSEEELKVCIIGGGPGSELLALAKYYCTDRPDEQVSVSLSQIDRVGAWSENVQVLKHSLHAQLKEKYGKKKNWPLLIDTNLMPLDVSKKKSLEHLAHTFEFDLAIMSYVISEIFDFEAFKPILTAIKQGKGKNRYVLITDRSDKRTKENIDLTINFLGATVVTQFQKRSNLDGDEQTRVLKEAFPSISRSPRVTWDSVAYLLRL